MKQLDIPQLDHRCNSWIVVKDGRAVHETWSRQFIENVAQNAREGVEIFTALQWLQNLNKAA